MLIYRIVQRLELLYRPTYSLHPTAAAARGRTAQQPEVVLTNFSSTTGASSSSPTPPPANDPPPKYTPPPSYSTATGARIARMIREVMVAAHLKKEKINAANVKVNKSTPYRLNMELDLQSLVWIHVHSCTHWLRPRNLPPPSPLAFGLIYEGTSGQPR